MTRKCDIAYIPGREEQRDKTSLEEKNRGEGEEEEDRRISLESTRRFVLSAIQMGWTSAAIVLFMWAKNKRHIMNV